MNKIAMLRKQKGISQAKLGEIIGAAQNTVCNWENGNREPDNEMLTKLSKYFDVSTDYLLNNELEEQPEELIILNRAAKKMTPENRQKLLEMARLMFKEDFDDDD